MLHFTRHLRRKLIENGSLRKYFIYSTGEIILIVIGVLLALQVNTMNENRIKKNSEKTIYQTLKDQLIN